MASLVWDALGSKTYETGVDKGVLYLSDGSAVPWNGLTSVVEHTDTAVEPIYYDGKKINNLYVTGDFTANIKAVTYPDRFPGVESFSDVRPGFSLGNQPPETFNLCYRTKVGNDILGEKLGYKIHIIYNATAIPSDKSYLTDTNSAGLLEFEWVISAVPQEYPGYRPTAHIVIDSRTFNANLLTDLETSLYGSSSSSPLLKSFSDMIDYINNWNRVNIVANNDGTFTASSSVTGDIVDIGSNTFTISNANVVTIDSNTYTISSSTS